LPEGFKRAFGTGMLPVILLNLGIGFLGRNIIDNALIWADSYPAQRWRVVVSYKRPGGRTGVTIACGCCRSRRCCWCSVVFIWRPDILDSYCAAKSSPNYADFTD